MYCHCKRLHRMQRECNRPWRLSTDATRRALIELFVFYVLIFIGFGTLWLTYKSNSRIRKIREDLKRTLHDQRGKKYEPPDDAKMYGMF